MGFSCHSRKMSLLCVWITIAILISGYPVKHALAENLSVTENNLKVTYNIVNAWGNCSQAEVSIENVGEAAINDWQIEFLFDSTSTISSIWNAVAISSEMGENSKIVVQNETYNASINPDCSTSFGMIIQGAADEIPEIHVLTQTNGQGYEGEGILFPYAVFCKNDFLFQGWKSTVCGDVYTGTDFNFQGSELNVLGEVKSVGRIIANGSQINIENRTEAVTSIDAPDFSLAITSLAERMTEVDPSLFNSQDQLVVNGYYMTNDNLTISGTKFSGDCVIIADGDITYNVDSISGDGRVVLFSRNGNITINGSQITLNGLIYAPNGSVDIFAYDTTINGRIVANSVNYSGSILNISTSTEDIQLFSELPIVKISYESNQVELGESITYSVLVEQRESPYEVFFRVNGNAVDIQDSLSYSFVPDMIGDYTLEAFVVTDFGTVVLARGTVTVFQENIDPITPTTDPSITETPIPTITDTPTPTPQSGEIEIGLNTDQFVPSENPYFFYIMSSIEEVSGTLSNSQEVETLTYSISSVHEENYKTGNIEVAENWSSSEIGFFWGPTKLVITATTKDGNIFEIMYVFLSYTDVNAEKLGIDIKSDTDGDYLSDYLEQELGTNSHKKDTDEDHVIDSIEVFFLQTDPLNPDSDDNGVIDGYEDFDSDGLTNDNEMTGATLFYKADTDEDRLLDGEEINVYGTDPINDDTDDDGISDYEEIMMGTNPLSPDVEQREQTADYIVDNDESPEIVGVSITMSTERYLPSVISVSDVYNVNMPSTEVVARVGSPLQFDSVVDFDSAAVTIKYDENSLGSVDEDNLGILWFDEENLVFEVVENVAVDTENNTLTMILDHFSIYVMIDLVKWNQIWSDPIDYYTVPDSDTERYDYIFMVEANQAVSGEFGAKSRRIMEEFIQGMRPGERFGIGCVYNNCAYFDILTENKQYAKTLVNTAMLQSYPSMDFSVPYAVMGMKNIYDGVEKTDNIPVLILITTNTHPTYNNSYCYSICNSLGARVYTINLGTPGGWNKLSNFNHLRFWGELDDTLDLLMIDTDGYELVEHGPYGYWYDFMNGREKDSDQDGIPDVYEIRGIRSYTGKIITSNPYDPDSNHDGYDDWYEYMFSSFNLVYRRFSELYGDLPEYKGQHILQTWQDPTVTDDDGDGLYAESARFYFDINGKEQIILPIDPDSSVRNMPKSLTETHVSTISSESKTCYYTTGSQVPEFSGFRIDPLGFAVDVWATIVDIFVGNGSKAKYCASYVGCVTLGFFNDEKNIAAHSSEDQWQRLFGYCDLYDVSFRVGTGGNIRVLKLPKFTYEGEEYVFWAWRGTYLNLGTGAEIGFYYRPKELADLTVEDPTNVEWQALSELFDLDSIDDDWWAASPYSLNMQLDLYTKENGYYECVSSWHPYAKQWWITVFNYHRWNPNSADLYVIGKIDFNQAKYYEGGVFSARDIYWAFKEACFEQRKGFSYSSTVIFDDHTYSVYILWGDDVHKGIYETA
ncbi:MAG: cellulose binding domain-containing protein [Clostridiales bacterium]|nr:cellulose binding domain-containing protein [Clostridiales bacterium]